MGFFLGDRTSRGKSFHTGAIASLCFHTGAIASHECVTWRSPPGGPHPNPPQDTGEGTGSVKTHLPHPHRCDRLS
ncbi:hypothetical protein [Oscillatoria acuminata]|uniref:hypothetical protein n=1 Tax=Oscillatoria acuminata TaxID=118323 RepID=UPI00030DAAD0|nr:hypothetical protein [Oscillatoria acuminata]